MIKAVRGFKDILPEEIPYFRFLEERTKEILETFGYREIRIPVLEHIELFVRGIGSATDIVEKEMYTLEDKGGDTLALRPEATAGIARSFIENALHLKYPVTKFYFFGPMFRYERPQAGRLRQFHQLNVEAFGIKSPSIDAEIIYMLHLIMEKVGISKSINIEVNHLGCNECRPIYRKILIGYLESKKDKLCKDCKRRLEKNPLRILDCKNLDCKNISLKAPKAMDHLCNECKIHFERCLSYLDDLKVPYTINPLIVRGLDYYTGIVFEAITTELGAQNAVAAGGRYDNLIEELGGPKIPGIGFAIGEERAVSLIRKFVTLSEEPIHIFFAVLGERALKTMLPIVCKLRERGVKSEIEHEPMKSLKSQMRKADKLKANFVVIVGDDEIDKGKIILRNMKDGKQTELVFDEDKLIEFFTGGER